jgi:hypothetical protein
MATAEPKPRWYIRDFSVMGVVSRVDTAAGVVTVDVPRWDAFEAGFFKAERIFERDPAIRQGLYDADTNELVLYSDDRVWE